MDRWFDGPQGRARNRYAVDGDTVIIYMTRGTWALVDLADFALVSHIRWTPMHRDSRRPWLGFYAYNTGRRFHGRAIYMHRLIAETAEDALTDHEDGNGLNNRRGNLRTASRVQNSHNRLPNRTTAKREKLSPYKGVSKHGDRWEARIRIPLPEGGAKTLRLGTDHDQKNCARVYDAAALEHFGPFAVTNAALGLL